MVCEDDYDVSTGLCSVCKETMCEVCHSNLSIGTCKICGRLVCSKDSVRQKDGSLICVNCLSGLE